MDKVYTLQENLRELQSYFHESAHRFADYYATMAEQAEPELAGSHFIDWIAQLDSEYDNLYVVLLWAIRMRQAEYGLRLAGSLRRYWSIREHYREITNTLMELLVWADESHYTIARTKALLAVAELAQKLGNLVAARTLLTESILVSRKIDYKIGIAGGLLNLGALLINNADYSAALPLLQESLTLWRALENQHGLSFALHNLGMCYQGLDDNDSARQLLEESLAIGRTLNTVLQCANALEHLGNIAEEQGEYTAARSAFVESLEIRRQFGDKLGIAESLESFVALAVANHRYECALSLSSAANCIRRSLCTPMMPREQQRYNDLIARAERMLADHSIAKALNYGSQMSIEAAIDYALFFA